MIKNILKDSSIIYLYQGLALVFGMTSSILIARHFGPSGKGEIDLFLLIGTLIVEFLILGLGSSMIRFSAKLKYSISELHGITIYYALFVGVLCLILIAILYTLDINYIYLVSILIAPLLLYKQIANSLLISLNKVITTYKINFFIALVLLLSVYCLYIYNLLTLNNYLIIFVIISLITIVIIFKFIKNHHKNENVDFNKKTFKELISFGFIIHLGAIMNIMHFKVDQLMISSILSVAELGIYTVSVRWAEMIFFIDTAIVSVILYKVTSGDKDSAYKLAYISSIIIGLIGIFFFFFFFFFSDKLILFLYGKEFSSAIEPLMYLILGVICWSLSKPLSAFMVLQVGKTFKVTLFASIGFIINIIFNFILIKTYGIKGAAISSMISYLVVLILVVILFTNYKSKDSNDE